jgi:hypothetical protein
VKAVADAEANAGRFMSVSRPGSFGKILRTSLRDVLVRAGGGHVAAAERILNRKQARLVAAAAAGKGTTAAEHFFWSLGVTRVNGGAGAII